MNGSVGSGDVLGGGPGQWVLGLCILGVLVVFAPIGLAALGFGAIVGLVGGSTGGTPQGNSLPNSPDPVTVIGGSKAGAVPLQPVMASANGLVVGWASRDALNQYARQNYQTDQSWQTWRAADCSAAALAWLLRAYGQPLDSIDAAIGLIGPGTGISTKLGLLDARGDCVSPRARKPWSASTLARPASARVGRGARGLAGSGPTIDGWGALVRRGPLVRRHRVRPGWGIHPRLERLGHAVPELVATVRRGGLQRVGSRGRAMIVLQVRTGPYLPSHRRAVSRPFRPCHGRRAATTKRQEVFP